MSIFKKKAAAEKAVLTEEFLIQRTVGRILVIVTVGILLLLFDLFVGFDFSTVPLLKEKDSVYLVRPAEGSSAGHIDLVANIQTDRGTVTKEYELSLYPCERERSAASGPAGGSRRNTATGRMSEEELLAYEMRSVINSLNDDLSVRRVTLPDHLRTGETITWGTEKKTNTAMIALAMILLALFVYKRRLDPLEKIRRSQMTSVNRQLPEFASRLVLLLGAGLVLSAAFEHIIEESRQTESLAGDTSTEAWLK